MTETDDRQSGGSGAGSTVYVADHAAHCDCHLAAQKLHAALEAAQAEIDRLQDMVTSDEAIDKAILTRRLEVSRATEAELRAKVERLEAERVTYRNLLANLWQWDMMSCTADGPYWRKEIDAALDAAEPLK